MKTQIYAFLDSIGIAYERYQHEAAFHMEDCAELDAKIGAVTCKNYFLTTKSRKIHCLCIVRPEARLKTSDVSKQAGTPRLSFADEEALMEYLHVYPGSVSPMGLIFDGGNRVRMLADSGLKGEARLAFHPCDNTETLVMSAEDFFGKFLPAMGHSVTWVSLSEDAAT